MKNLLKFLLMVSMLVTVVLFAFGCDEQSTPPVGDTSSNKAAKVSLYDEEGNLLRTVTYTSQEDNTLDVSEFKRSGYKFVGVYDYATSSVRLFNANGYQSPSVLFDQDYKAVVKYEPITYQLVFDAGEGKLVNSAEYSKNISYDEAVGLFPDVKYDGMELDGWFDENGNRYSLGTTPVYSKFNTSGFTIGENEIIKLHAKYEEKYCNVTLIYGDGTTASVSVRYGERLPTDMSAYVKDTGSSTVSGFGVSYGATTSYTDCVYTDMELYAIWKDYTYVSFVYAENDIRPMRVYRESNGAVTLSDGEREGYTFDGWYSSELFTGNKVTTVSFGSLADTYYAKWTIAKYTISFVADGKLVSSSTFTIEEADIFVPPVPVKSHYTGKWESYTLEYKTMIVNAVYTPEKITITLFTGTDYNYKSIVYGENFSLNVPTKKGYTFDGWFYNGERVTDASGNSVKPYTFDAAVTLTANWKNVKCKLFFESNGGSEVNTVEVDYGTPYTLTQIPQREGWYFGGWFDESLLNEYIDTITITKNTIVYAKWIKSVAVYDAESLAAIADNPYGNYHLTTNINLRGEVWTPIENFYGILNGDGYKIYNFSLKQDSCDLAFIINNSGTIKNLSLSNIELSSKIEGGVNCSVGVLCAYNKGNLLNVSMESINALVNVTSNSVNNTMSIGMIVGENSGKIISCSVKSSLVLNTNLGAHYNDYYTTINVGGLCGRDDGAISDVESSWSVDINECLYTTYGGSAGAFKGGVKYGYLNIGAICGWECGTLIGGVASLTCIFNSDAWSNHGEGCVARYTNIGGVVGKVGEVASVSNCYSYGTMELKRVGKDANSYEFYNGGVVGKVENGTVNNCASSVNMTLKEGYGGYIAGIAGCVSQNGRVSNAAYYGEIKTTAYTGGYFTGLFGLVDGVATKAYFHGKILTDSANTANLAAVISSSGSVSKTIGNSNLSAAYVSNSGAANSNYIIGTDYGVEFLTDTKTMFETLCLFEADIWAVDDEEGLYLIAFPEFDLPNE